MANLMQRFFKSKSCLLPIQRLATTTPSLIPYQNNPYIESVCEKPDPVSLLRNPVISISRNESDRFYPSFPMGYVMNPSLIRGVDLGEMEEKEEKEIVIYADSVKKKRKKKMNKHKYRKLRKRLGRKS